MEILQDFPDYKAPRMYPHRGLSFRPSNISYIPLPGLFYHTSEVLPQNDGSYMEKPFLFPVSVPPDDPVFLLLLRR